MPAYHKKLGVATVRGGVPVARDFREPNRSARVLPIQRYLWFEGGRATVDRLRQFCIEGARSGRLWQKPARGTRKTQSQNNTQVSMKNNQSGRTVRAVTPMFHRQSLLLLALTMAWMS